MMLVLEGVTGNSLSWNTRYFALEKLQGHNKIVFSQPEILLSIAIKEQKRRYLLN